MAKTDLVFETRKRNKSTGQTKTKTYRAFNGFCRFLRYGELIKQVAVSADGNRTEMTLFYDDGTTKPAPKKMITEIGGKKTETIFYHPDGKRKEKVVEMGEGLSEKFSYYPNDDIKRIAVYKDDVLSGFICDFYHTRRKIGYAQHFYSFQAYQVAAEIPIKSSGLYAKGKKILYWPTYDESKNLTSEAFYCDDGSEVGYKVLLDKKGEPNTFIALQGDTYVTKIGDAIFISKEKEAGLGEEMFLAKDTATIEKATVIYAAGAAFATTSIMENKKDAETAMKETVQELLADSAKISRRETAVLALIAQPQPV